MFTRIVFFGALPTIFAGLRIALAVSFIVLVAAEFVATKSRHRLPDLEFVGAPGGRHRCSVGIVTIGILGLITSALFQEIERKVIPWKAE